ncbi:hypothetical protein D3C86_1686220 [compost metagenome]
MFGDDENLLGAMHQIHGAANGGHALGANAPIGEITILRHLIGAEDRHIQMPAAHHGEAVGMVEEGGAGLQRHGLLAGIDEVPVLFAFRRRFAEIQDAVFSVENRLTAGRLVSRHHFRKADAEIDVSAVLDVLRRTPCDLGVGKLDVFAGVDGRGHA